MWLIKRNNSIDMILVIGGIFIITVVIRKPVNDINNDNIGNYYETLSNIPWEDLLENNIPFESDIIKKVSKLSGVVIAIGGGSPIREENRLALKQNGIVYYIKRNLENLVSDNRPLSKAKGVLEIYNERKEIYENFADYVIVNDKSPQGAVEEILKNENTRY